jgi:NAD(P)-dependent dehydrogenase (short-subunit alcohol dehydrogenase family)
MRDLDGKIALVTGGGKGVGKVIARTLAERGAHVLINCFHSYERAKQTQAELVAGGAQVDVLRASVARKDQVDRMFDEIEQRFGHVDILVNNAASGWLGPVSQIGPEHFAKALDANLLGSFWCAMRAAPLMAARGGGQIVNISSNGAGMVPDNYLVVGTSKAAVEALSRHLAAQLAPMNIRVNTASCSLIAGEVAELFPRSA